jgi:molybdenum cofactor synthesis domain-containing protein
LRFILEEFPDLKDHLHDEEEGHLHYHGVDKAEQHLSVRDALRILLESISPTKPETLWVSECDARVVYEDVQSPQDLPRFARSTRDGYALSLPANIENDTEYHAFTIIGEVKIGEPPRIEIKSGQAARVATGSYLPTGTNAILMVEYANVENNILRFARPLRIGENILRPGEDLRKGDLLLTRGSRIHPQHVALFSMLGLAKLRVFSKPRIAIFSTGDELKDPPALGSRKKIGSDRDSFHTFDSNRPFLASALTELGANPVDLGIVRDNFREIKSAFLKALKCDAVILSAGSSIGERDFATKALQAIAGVKPLVHGVAMRPSSPTGLASYNGKPVISLPGFPTSAIVSFFVFGRPAVLKLAGASTTAPMLLQAKMKEEYSGKRGLTHFVRVRVAIENGEFLAEIARPTEAQYSSWLRLANGIAIIGEDGNAVVKPGGMVSFFPIGEIPEEKII